MILSGLPFGTLPPSSESSNFGFRTRTPPLFGLNDWIMYGPVAGAGVVDWSLAGVFAGTGAATLLGRLCPAGVRRQRGRLLLLSLLIAVGAAGLLRDVRKPYKTEGDERARQFVRSVLERAEGEPIVLLDAPPRLYPSLEWYLRLEGREVTWARSLEDFPTVHAGVTIGVRDVAAVTHQTACHDIFALRVNCWDCMVRGQGHYPITFTEEEPVTLKQYGTCTLLGCVRKGCIQLVPGAGADDKQFPAERVRRCSILLRGRNGLFSPPRRAD